MNAKLEKMCEQNEMEKISEASGLWDEYGTFVSNPPDEKANNNHMPNILRMSQKERSNNHRKSQSAVPVSMMEENAKNLDAEAVS